MNKIALILQSNYIPWKGYFDLINMADEFIIYDTAQFTHGDWRNRNRIQTSQGPQWLTIPAQKKGRLDRSIRDTRILDNDWHVKHWKTLCQNYSKAPYFKDLKDGLEQLYKDRVRGIKHLSEVNFLFLTHIMGLLGIHTRVSWAEDYELAEGKTSRLVKLCQDVGATVYLSGPAAKDYLEEGLFTDVGIEVRWMDYSGYPEYPQLHGKGFEHGVTILDMLFNLGPEGTRAHMKSFSGSRP